MTKRLKRNLWNLSCLIFALTAGFIAVKSFQLVQVETARQNIQQLMLEIQRGLGGDIGLLLSNVDALPESVPFENALSETRADARVLALYTANPTGLPQIELPTPESIIGDYQHALEISPGNGYLWAKYAQFLEYQHIDRTQDDFRHALSQAIALGPHDYNTIKVVVAVGIRGWPHLDCNLQMELISLIERAEKIDDRSLNQWNTQLGRKGLRQHINELYELHGFNLRWAKSRTGKCPL